MVEIILAAPPLNRWKLRWCLSPRVGLSASGCLQTTRHPTRKRWLMDCPALPRVVGAKGLPSPADFRETWDYWVVWVEKTVALAKALQRCTVHSRMPLGVLLRAVQELHKCLAPMVENGDQFDLKMLDIGERDPESPTSAERALSVTPEREEATSSEELALVPRWGTPLPPKFTLSWMDESSPPPLKDADWPMSILLGSQLDLTPWDPWSGLPPATQPQERCSSNAKPGSLPRQPCS